MKDHSFSHIHRINVDNSHEDERTEPGFPSSVQDAIETPRMVSEPFGMVSIPTPPDSDVNATYHGDDEPTIVSSRPPRMVSHRLIYACWGGAAALFAVVAALDSHLLWGVGGLLMVGANIVAFHK